MSYRILGGDCVARMNMLNPESIDNIITDPPYEIGFMGKGWDLTYSCEQRNLRQVCDRT